jgi:MFS transporter, FSR family, fosmidomycin resistance protein
VNPGSDLGWRALFFAFAALALAPVVLAVRAPDTDGDDGHPRVREALRLLVQREVFRWLLLAELSDLLLDVFLGFVALYFVDEVGTAASTGLAVAVWTGAGLVGSAAMIPLLRRVDGLAYLRVSAAATGLLFVAFCSCPRRAEARAGRDDLSRQRRLVPGVAGSPLRRARSGQRPRAHGWRALPR